MAEIILTKEAQKIIEENIYKRVINKSLVLSESALSYISERLDKDDLAEQVFELVKVPEDGSDYQITKKDYESITELVLTKVVMPKDGEQGVVGKTGSKGEQGSRGKTGKKGDTGPSSERFDQKNLDHIISEIRKDAVFATKEELDNLVEGFMKSLKSGKLATPNRSGGANGPEIAKKLNAFINNQYWQEPPISRINPLGFAYLTGDEETDGSIRFNKEGISGMPIFEKLISGIWQPASIEFGPSSVFVGSRVGIAAAGHHLLTEDTDGHFHFHAHSLFDGETTNGKAQIINAYNYTERLVAQPDNTGNWTGTNFEYVALGTLHSLVGRGYFQTHNTAATEPVRIQVWEGTDDTGTVVLDQTHSASHFPANSEVGITYNGYLEFELGILYFIRQSSDASFSLKLDSTNTYPWAAADLSEVREDDILQTKMWASGDTFIHGQWSIQNNKIYACNEFGIQSSTFADNSDKWDELISVQGFDRILTTTAGQVIPDNMGNLVINN